MIQRAKLADEHCGVLEYTYTAGATLAFWTVERLMFRACSLTRDFASTIEDPAFVERHRTKEDVRALFCALWTRILAAGSDMVDYDRPPNEKRDREMEGGRREALRGIEKKFFISFSTNNHDSS